MVAERVEHEVVGTEPGLSVADELRLHVHGTLGGLAQPQAVVVLDRFPDDVADGSLLAALQALAASAPPLSTVTAAQLRATAQGLTDLDEH